MNSAAGDSEYFFKFDAPIPSVVFERELNLTGWLLRKDAKPIHGLRALVRRKLSRKQTFRARRKRHRPEVAASYPSLPEASASGFLFELTLRLGRNHLAFQLLDHERRWQTFAAASVTALPLLFLERIKLGRTRAFVISEAQKRVGQSSRLQSSEALRATPFAWPQTRRINLFATSKSNLFMLEIGELVAAGFRELGLEASLQVDAIPQENPPTDTLQIVVAPHEYHHLFLSEKFSPEQAIALTKNVLLLSTEQPGTSWFQESMRWARHSLGVVDLNPLGVTAYREHGIAARNFGLGFHPLLQHSASSAEKLYDVIFLGSLTERREKFLAQHAGFFSRHQCHLHLVPLEFAKTSLSRSYLPADRRNQLLSQSRILLNLHHSDQPYFEWHRALLGLANGCCLITETCQGYGRLVPNEHFVMVEPEHLIDACEYFLAHPAECARIAQAGREFAETELRQAQLCRQFLHLAIHEPSTDQPAATLSLELRRTIARATRRSFAKAVAEDLRSLTVKPTPPLSYHLADRSELIQKRAEYHQRFLAQEESGRRGEPTFQLHENAVWNQSAPPPLSIVITLYNYAHYLEACVTSIERAAAELPGAPELVIVNDASTDDSLGIALKIQAASKLPTRIVDKKFNTGLADARNLGLQNSRGDYLFIMDADNLVFPQALRQLLEALTREQASAAYSLLCRFRDHPSHRVGLLSYFAWDPQILVRYPYIDAMAMFRRDALLQLGGYDHELSQIGWFGWEDYDLWLRFAQQNQRVAFVANTLCLYRDHKTSMINATKLFAPELVKHFEQRYGDLVRQFEPRSRLFGVDRADKPQRFLIASGCPVATTTLYRCIHLREQLELLGHKAEVVDWFDETNIEPERARLCDALILYRLPISEPLAGVIAEAKAAGKAIIFDTDDLVFEPGLVDAQPGIAHFTAERKLEHTDGARRYRETLQACHAVTTATPVLAELAASHGLPTFVHRNALGREMEEWANELYTRRQKNLTSGRVVIGYGSGTATHDLDFLEAAPALAEALSRYPTTELWIVGPLALPAALEGLDRVLCFPLTDWRRWFELASQFDLALAPLQPENVFCRAKSEIKFVEAGALGVALVASRMEPFSSVITNGEDGFLAGDTKEWSRVLALVLEQPELRLRVGESARATVLRSYSQQVRAAELKALLPQLTAARTP